MFIRLNNYDMGFLSRENLTLLYANINGLDQPVHPHSLISTFVVFYLERKVVNLAPCNISNFPYSNW